MWMQQAECGDGQQHRGHPGATTDLGVISAFGSKFLIATWPVTVSGLRRPGSTGQTRR